MPDGPGWRQRLRAAWELSRPQAYGVVLEEEPPAVPAGRLERAQQAVASLFYFATFVFVVVAVFFRFVLDQPLVWSLEVPTYCFFWCFCVAAGLSDWRDEQIAFDLVSQRMPPRLRLAAHALANLVIVVAFAVALPGTVAYLQLELGRPTTGLPFPEAWGFAGILPFLVIAILLRGRLLLRQVGGLLRPAR
jgi:TRAP-type C4-dicarboxylate transport system permease small subunit